MAENWHTLADRLRWAIGEQPPVGRQRGLRLFQRRMEEHAPDDVAGTSLSAIQGYLRGDAEPSPSFLRLAARLLSVRASWLAWGEGAPTEEEEASRRGSTEAELSRVSAAAYEALGIPTEVRGERFFGPAPWAPTVRQTALRLYQYRPAWELLRSGGWDGSEDPDVRFERAVQDVVEGLSAPLRAIGVEAAHLSLADVGYYVSALNLVLQQVMDAYAPDDGEVSQQAEENYDNGD